MVHADFLLCLLKNDYEVMIMRAEYDHLFKVLLILETYEKEANQQSSRFSLERH